MVRLIFIIISIFLFLSSCSFNRFFLFPKEIPDTSREFVFNNPKNNEKVNVNVTGDKYQPVFISNKMDTVDFGYTIESVLFKSKSGNLLNGWFLKPKNDSVDITLLHMHGNAGCLYSQLQAISPMLDHHFQIFMFDYSGFGYSEGKATKNNILKDALSALDYVKERKDVKDTKLVIYGQSLGGHASVVVASQQEEIDGLVTEGAFSSHKDIAASKLWLIGRLLVKQGYCAKKSIKDYHKPLLVIHSTEDEVVPFYMGKKIFINANQPKEFLEIKYGHICGPTFYSSVISEKIRTMLKK